MSEAQSPSMHPAVLAVAKDLVERDGQWFLPEDKIHAHCKTLTALSLGQRDKLITDLVVLAARFDGEPEDRVEGARLQIFTLACVLLGGVEAASSAFERAGVDVAQAKRLIGAGGIKFEDSAQRKPGAAAASVLGLLKSKK